MRQRACPFVCPGGTGGNGKRSLASSPDAEPRGVGAAVWLECRNSTNAGSAGPGGETTGSPAVICDGWTAALGRHGVGEPLTLPPRHARSVKDHKSAKHQRQAGSRVRTAKRSAAMSVSRHHVDRCVAGTPRMLVQAQSRKGCTGLCPLCPATVASTPYPCRGSDATVGTEQLS